MVGLNWGFTRVLGIGEEAGFKDAFPLWTSLWLFMLS